MGSKILRLKIFILIGFMFMSVLGLIAQEKAELSASDQKILQNAEKESEKASSKNKEADKIYAEVSAKQSSLTSEETDKLNNKAIVKQTEANKIEYGAQKMRYNVYATRVERFWIKNSTYIDKMAYARSLDNNAKNEFSQAEDLYREHETVQDNLMKFSKLSDANERIGKALEGMKKAFDICANPEVSVTEPLPVEEKKQDSIIPPSIDTVSIAPAKTDSSVTIPAQEKPVETIIPEVQKDSAPIAEPVPTPMPETEISKEPVSQPASSERNQEPVAEPQRTNTSAAPSFTTSEGVFYRIQIAASRVPLNAEQLGLIYQGPEPIDERLIHEWYKYTIGNFSDFDSAEVFKDECGVQGAFVVRR